MIDKLKAIYKVILEFICEVIKVKESVDSIQEVKASTRTRRPRKTKKESK